MKRNWEKILGIIGASLDGLAIIAGLFLWVLVYAIHISTERYSFPILDFLTEVILFLSYIVLFFVAISLVCLILALFALKKLKINMKVSGYLFLIAAVFSGSINIYLMVHISMFLPIQSIVYLVAGILCLLDKSKIESKINKEEIQIIE